MREKNAVWNNGLDQKLLNFIYKPENFTLFGNSEKNKQTNQKTNKQKKKKKKKSYSIEKKNQIEKYIPATFFFFFWTIYSCYLNALK